MVFIAATVATLHFIKFTGMPEVLGGKPLLLYICGQLLNLLLTLGAAYLMFYKVFPEIAATI